ncbi:glycoside hydrolase family 28 protein [Mucilaginibacter sp. SP1R1]|uniref:glycoside hydrolase family 28 protein n=1 Tax=Mucilaginibacter sp. SP1R1 TaxID=2723091 RepID=UPI00161769F6|nr:glycosyl hydrolase family 28 protein [Mucilaginibacter sp. SP1R1]MBB6148897.1 polygalacturonase [Mucilaginibacter sp. SP1R1]
MKKAFLFIVFSIITHQLWAQQNIFNIVAFGAKADGKTSNTEAIQHAIDKAAENGGGQVLVPAGSFVTGVIIIKSGVDLHLAANAVLLATTKRIDYGPEKASALIVAEGQHNISLTGTGTIDGQGELLLKDIYVMLRNGKLKDSEWQKYNEWGQMRPEENNRPKLIVFKNCQNVTIKNITIKNGLCWIQDYRSCTDMVIDNIKVLSNTFLNNDGIDLVDCKNVKLTNSSFNVADDGICLKSYDSKGFCENIYIANCKIRSSASAFKLGTASHGGFKKITVRNIYVYDTFRSAIAIETVDGAVLEDIDIRGVTAKNTGNAIFIRLGKRLPNVLPGRLARVYIGDVKVQVPAGKPDSGYSMEGPKELFAHNVFPSSISGIPGYPVQDITLENIAITYASVAKKTRAFFNADSLEKIPEKISDYPEFSMFGELPAWGFYVRHANGIKMKNIKLSYTGADFRPACIFDDVDTLTLNHVQITDAASKPIIILNKVKKQSLHNLLLPDKYKGALRIK